MSSPVETLVNNEYKYGFVTEIDADVAPRASTKTPSASSPPRRPSPSGCSNGGSRRSGAGRRWPSRTAGPTSTTSRSTIRTSSTTRRRRRTKPLGSLDEVDPKLLETYTKLGIPLTSRSAGGRGGRRDLRLASRSEPATRRGCRSRGSSSAPSARRCASTPIWCAPGSDRWCRRATTSLRRSTPPCSATAPSCTSRRA